MKDVNIKVKTALILVVTLLIGIVFGAMLHRAFYQERIKSFLAMRTPEGFARRFNRIIDVRADQEEKVNKILDTYAEKFQKLNQEHKAEVLSLFRSFHEELAKILTPAQMQRIRQGMMKPGPGPFGGPPPGHRPRTMDGPGGMERQGGPGRGNILGFPGFNGSREPLTEEEKLQRRKMEYPWVSPGRPGPKKPVSTSTPAPQDKDASKDKEKKYF